MSETPMADLPLRAACIHGRYESHSTGVGIYPGWCSDFRDITIDYEAAAQYLSNLIYMSRTPDESWPGEFDPYAKVESRKIVAAAIGDTDDWGSS